MSGNGTCSPALIGRNAELARVEQLLATTHTDTGAVLVLRGPAGIGKSALLDFAARQAGGRRLLRLRGVAAEADLPYAALQPLCCFLLHSTGQDRPAGHGSGHGLGLGLGLASEERSTLEIAVRMRAGSVPGLDEMSRALVAAMASIAASEPVLCMVDNAQWLDSQSRRALESVARRLAGLPVTLLVADRGDGFAGLPDLRLGGLGRDEARRLWESASHASVDETLLERILVEAQGTPRSLLESARQNSQADAARHPDARIPPHLTPDSRMLLIIAAADPTGDPALLARAAAHLKIGPAATAQNESEGLLSIGERVAFSCARLRRSAYDMATVSERHRAHAALAAATDPADEPDRRTWHLALANAGPDERLAAELVHWASMTWNRGGAPAAAAILAQAAQSTADATLRAERAVMAAEMYRAAGLFETAGELLAMAELGPADEVRSARVALLRAGVMFDTSRSRAAAARLLRAAHHAVAREAAPPAAAFGEALAADVLAGGVEAAHQTRRWMTQHPEHGIDELLAHVVRRCIDGSAAAAGSPKPAGYPPTPLACSVAAALWDDESWHGSTSLLLARTKRLGMRAILPQALSHRALFEVHAGEFDAAQSLVDEAASVSEVLGTAPFTHATAVLAAWRGQKDHPALDLPGEPRRPAAGAAEAIRAYAVAVLYNALGEYGKAVDVTRPVLEGGGFDSRGWSLAELVEAAVRSGDRETAQAALERLSACARPSGGDWAIGIEARAQALLQDGQVAEDLYVEAIARLRDCRMRTHRARAELVYGEWLRRRGRRVDARVPLRSAHQAFLDMGAPAFAERAQRELLATSERARRRVEETRALLTPHERQVAVLARDGRSNPQIAAVLSISPRTVEYHLHKVFGKLGIASRAELHRVPHIE